MGGTSRLPRYVNSDKDKTDLATLANGVQGAVAEFLVCLCVFGNYYSNTHKIIEAVNRYLPYGPQEKNEASSDQCSVRLSHFDRFSPLNLLPYGFLRNKCRWNMQVVSIVKIHVGYHDMNKDYYFVGLMGTAEMFNEYIGRIETIPCFEGTRVEILATIKAWVKNTNDDQPRIFWLDGTAGLGKTTISHSVADWAQEEGILGAAHFFTRDVARLRDLNLLLPSLAYQLANFDKEFARKLAGNPLEMRAVSDREFDAQFEQLIELPWKASQESDSSRSGTATVLVVLDAIDESDSDTGITELLRILLSRSKLMPGRFLVFIASRPEAHIRSLFEATDEESYMYFNLDNSEKANVQKDIETVLRYRLSNLNLPSEMSIVLPEDWPQEQDIMGLAELSGNSFIYASTALRCIGDGQARDPVSRMRALLALDDETRLNPHSGLDKLYMHIILDAMSELSGQEHETQFQQIIATMALLRNPLPIDAFSGFLVLNEQDVHMIVRHLNSVISVPSSGPDLDHGCLRFLHSSFADFIRKPLKCPDERLVLDCKREEQRMCLRCLEVMTSTLTRDMLGIEGHSDTLHIGRSEAGGTRTDGVFTPLLQYACRFWASHLAEGYSSESGGDVLKIFVTKLAEFADHCLLFWLETMCWLGLTDDALAIMESVNEWMVRHYCLSMLMHSNKYTCI